MDEIKRPNTSLTEHICENESQQYGNTMEIEHKVVVETLKIEEKSDNKLQNESEILNESEKLSEKNEMIRQCDPCLFDEIEENASSFCVVCVEYLCKACARDHRRSKATRNHKVLTDSEMPDDPKTFKMMKSLVTCPEHPEMEVSFKCKTHGKFICTKCLVVNHRKCEDVIEISNQTTQETSIDNCSLQLLTDKLQSIYEMTISVRNAKEENIKQLQIDSTCIHTERSHYTKSVQEQLLKLDERMKSKTETILTKTLNELEEDVDKCKKIEMDEIERKELLDVALNFGNTTEVNIIGEKIETDIKGFTDETIIQKSKPVVSLKFERNQSFKDIASIGSVCVENGTNENIDQENTHKNETLLELSSEEIKDVEDNALCKPFIQSSVNKRRYMYDIQSSSDKRSEKCSLSSIIRLSDGGLVLADYSNKRIKVLDSKFSLLFEIELDGNPIDMCKYTKDILAIIVDGVKKIQKYSIGETNIYFCGEFPSKLYPISIGSIPDNDYQAIILFSDEEKKTPKKSDYDTIEIQIRNMNSGCIIKTFSELKNKSSLQMVLENPGRIRKVPNIQNAFLISEDKVLHCIETDKVNTNVLKETWFFKSYKGNIVAEITDITTDKDGNSYVCCKGTKSIHQISSMHYRNNRVLFSVPGVPLSLCVDDDNRQLVVGCEDDDFIYVINLE